LFCSRGQDSNYYALESLSIGVVSSPITFIEADHEEDMLSWNILSFPKFTALKLNCRFRISDRLYFKLFEHLHQQCHQFKILHI